MYATNEFSALKAGFYDSRIFLKRDDGFVTDKRKLYYFELEFYAESSGVIYIDDREYAVQNGFALIAKPGHERHSRLNYSAYYLHIKTSNSKIKDWLEALPEFFETTSGPEYFDVIRKISYALQNDFDGKDFYANSLIYKLFYMLATDSTRANRIETSYNRALMEQAVRYIDENFSSRIHLAEIASAANLSPTYFHKLFKAYTGKTPNDYLLDMRLSKAKEMLTGTTKSVEEIAFSCGFTSQSYFNAFFKKKTGITPLSFRKRELSVFDL